MCRQIELINVCLNYLNFHGLGEMEKLYSAYIFHVPQLSTLGTENDDWTPQPLSLTGSTQVPNNSGVPNSSGVHRVRDQTTTAGLISSRDMTRPQPRCRTLRREVTVRTRAQARRPNGRDNGRRPICRPKTRCATCRDESTRPVSMVPQYTSVLDAPLPTWKEMSVGDWHRQSCTPPVPRQALLLFSLALNELAGCMYGPPRACRRC
jgi:hypothetical protein